MVLACTSQVLKNPENQAGWDYNHPRVVNGYQAVQAWSFRDRHLGKENKVKLQGKGIPESFSYLPGARH